jgi:hypothetical protein
MNNNNSNTDKKKFNAFFILVIGVAILYFGNYVTDVAESAIFRAIGSGLGMGGDLMILYSIYRGIKFVFAKIKK